MSTVEVKSAFHATGTDKEADEKVLKMKKAVEIVDSLNEIAKSDELHDILNYRIHKISTSRMNEMSSKLKDLN